MQNVSSGWIKLVKSALRDISEQNGIQNNKLDLIDGQHPKESFDVNIICWRKSVKQKT